MYQFPASLKKAYESSPLSFVYYQNLDDRAVPVLVSDGFCRNVGMSRERVLDWLGTGLFERIHPDDADIVSQISDDFLHQRSSYDILFRCRMDTTRPDPKTGDDRYAPIHALGKWQTMPDGMELAVIAYANLSATPKVGREKIEVYSLLQRDCFYTDPLTGLPNTNYLHEFGDEKVGILRKDGKTPYVVFSDAYSMQSYNNQYGFKTGNHLLSIIADTLVGQFPEAFVMRGSGDHFIMILCLDNQEELERRLQESNAIIRKTADGNTFGIRSGVCPIETDISLLEALDYAKHTLKQIKHNMTRQVAFFSEESKKAYSREHYILEHFDQALENEWIKVYYHKLYRVESQKIAAFEGLARWIDPNHGMILPRDFIPVLLKYHQLYKLDLYMFEQVCREVAIWHENGLPPIPVSVNISQQDFDHADIAGEMNRLYEKYGLANIADKSYFIVEITEQDLAVGTDRMLEQLKKIRENGYRLWLDDFGSGYSAINVFSRFEVDLIKYDMDLLQHLDARGGINRLILKELVYIARKLGIHTLIEGLETEEHLSFVKEIGCELAQGFYYHKPELFDDVLFRMKNGDLANMCETSRERDDFNRQWFSP